MFDPKSNTYTFIDEAKDYLSNSSGMTEESFSSEGQKLQTHINSRRASYSRLKNRENQYKYEARSESHILTTHIKAKIHQLAHHEIYSQLTSTARIQCFMSYHIFAVWDFLKLLKSLQNKISLAWRREFSECPSEMNRLIDEIVFAEESELYPYGQPNESFALYLRAMAEIGVDPDCLWTFLESKDNLHSLKPGIKELIKFNSKIARAGTMTEITAAFFFGKEKLTPQLFTSITEVINQEGRECSLPSYYTEKLSRENSHQSESSALKLLDYLCQNETEKVKALQIGLTALNLREKLWNYALAEMTEIT